MEDDIDIEEHKLPPNLLDTSRFKTEQSDEGYEDEAMDTSSCDEVNIKYENSLDSISIVEHKPDIKISNDFKSEQKRHGQHIFDEKPTIIKGEITNIKSEGKELYKNADDEDSVDGDENVEDDKGFFAPVLVHNTDRRTETPTCKTTNLIDERKIGPSHIIYLGHKPPMNKSNEEFEESCSDDNYSDDSDEEDDENERGKMLKKLLLNTAVLLEDWGPKLDNSPRYCKECQILFPAVSSLQDHNESEHSNSVILYRCQMCDVTYNTYDKAVEHSQQHFNNLESNSGELCLVCGVKVDGTCFEEHKKLHDTNKNIELLIFNYTELFTKKWWEMTSSTQHQVLSTSIYKYNRGVKLRLVKDGPEKTILFQCGKCEIDVHHASLAEHVDSCSGKPVGRFSCGRKACGLKFSSLRLRDTHYSHHKWTDTFKTVRFNEAGDEEFNATLKRSLKKSDEKSYYHFYQCIRCKCCSEYSIDIHMHSCFPLTRRICDECQLHFSEHYARHKTLHRIGRIDKEMIKITPYEPPAEPLDDKTVAEKCKCKCGLRFNSRAGIEKHLLFDSCSEGLVFTETRTELATPHQSKAEISVEVVPRLVSSVMYRCCNCGLLFRNRSVLTHHTLKCDGQRRDDDKNCSILNVTTEEKSRFLYKCRHCHVHHLTLADAVRHSKSDHDERKVPCQYCKLYFSLTNLVEHISIQHKDLDAKPQDLIIQTVPFKRDKVNTKAGSNKQGYTITLEKDPKNSIEKVGIDKKSNDNNIYHCENCSLNFMQFNGLENHLMSCGGNIVKIKCAVCGLLFAEEILKNHTEIHHDQMKFTLQDINVIKTKFDIFHMAEEYQVDSEALMKSILSCYEQNSAAENTEKKVLPINSNDLFSNKLYKCNICSSHFLTFELLEWHQRNSKHGVPKQKCTSCGYHFSVKDLPTHVFIHHDKMALTSDDFEIFSNEIDTYIHKNTPICLDTDMDEVELVKQDCGTEESVIWGHGSAPAKSSKKAARPYHPFLDIIDLT